MTTTTLVSDGRPHEHCCSHALMEMGRHMLDVLHESGDGGSIGKGVHAFTRVTVEFKDITV